MNVEQLDKAVWFDMVLAPGELAEAYDQGPTSDADGVRVGPVTLVDEAELDDRKQHAGHWGCRWTVDWHWSHSGQATSTTRVTRPEPWLRHCSGWVSTSDADRYRRIQPDTCQRACSP